MLVALLVCLIPTTIGALLSAIGIAGMDRLVQHNVLAMSGRAVEAAGDVNTLLLDKTGTITLGNRQAAEFLPVAGVSGARAGRRRPALQPGRRDPRGPLDRRARQAASTGCASASPGELRRRRLRAVHRPDPDVRRRPRRRPPDPQGRRRGGDGLGARERRAPDRRGRRDRRRHLRQRRHAAASWPRSADGHGARALGVIHLKDVVKDGHARALRRDAPDGHPHRHDHRRQPADRQGDRRGGRGRRLPGRGHARGQDGADPARSRRAAGWSR